MEKQLIYILFLLTLVSCDNITNKSEVKDNTQGIDLRNDSTVYKNRGKYNSTAKAETIDTIQAEKEESTLKPFDIENFLVGRFLIGKEDELVDYRSLSIKGDMYYEFDENGNVSAAYYGISNIYNNYTYDKYDRLVKEERKQHNPPQTYGTTDYYYSKNSDLVSVVTAKLENGLPIKIDTLIDLKRLENLEPNYYKRRIAQKYLGSTNKNVVTFQDNLSFCCGFMMRGKNKLTYYINDKLLIDSLVIEGIDNDKNRTLIYEYK